LRTSHRQIALGNDMSSKYLWIAVDADEYELPLYVADSARELAEKFGTTKHNVESSTFYSTNGSMTGRRFLKVLKEE
jgi:hypothetical protein